MMSAVPENNNQAESDHSKLCRVPLGEIHDQTRNFVQIPSLISRKTIRKSISLLGFHVDLEPVTLSVF
jgi:hypothetical protein